MSDPDPVHLEIGEDYVNACISVLTPRAMGSAEDYQGWLEDAAQAHSTEIVSARLTDGYGLEPEDLDGPEGSTENVRSTSLLSGTDPVSSRSASHLKDR